jgi:hypothetical protein
VSSFALPRPAAIGLPDATIAVPVPSPGLTVHRLLEHDQPTQRDFEPALTRSQARVRGLPELFRGSVSHWIDEAQAVDASARPTCFVALVNLVAQSTVRVALTEEWGNGHVDVWAHPEELLAAVGRVERRRKAP